ncbi:MAG: T9SS C-terminal target domain-containing protein [Chitinophagia bacterium]|nr:T9SS C-terminal target domain-containing protein [Chitinophagia bacterium]
MNKLFLLLAAGSIALSASAQTPAGPIKGQFKLDEGSFKKNLNPIVHPATSRTAAKGTTGATGEWFFFNDCNYDASAGGAGITSAYIPIYPDSTIRVTPSSGSPFYWWNHGVGVSFDPSSPYFTPVAFAGPAGSMPTFGVTNQSYTVDSVFILGYYDRVKNYTDTLVIDLVSAPDSNSFLVNWRGASLQSYGITEDTVLSLADPYYDGPSNSINPARTPGVIKITKILDATAFNDTNSFGTHSWTFPVTPALSVAGGEKVVAYVHFKSGYRYPFNTSIDSANMWRHFTQDFSPTALQLATDMSGGLFSTTEDRYVITGKTTLGGVQPILTPAYFYTPAYVHNPYFGFFLKCPTCPPLATANVVEETTNVNVTPNPADNVVNIAYNLSNATNGTITLTNSVGQVVATQAISSTSGKASFNVANLANGVYIYTINAGSNRTTGRVVVAH